MSVTDQVDALRISAADPTDSLAKPRIIASIVMITVLIIWICAVMFLAGGLAARLHFGVGFRARLPTSPLWRQGVSWLGLVAREESVDMSHVSKATQIGRDNEQHTVSLYEEVLSKWSETRAMSSYPLLQVIVTGLMAAVAAPTQQTEIWHSVLL